MHTLETTAYQLVAPGKGILAMDESTGTCNKRFEAYGIDTTEENRRLYRQMLVTAPDLEQSVSGAILYDETIRQKTDDGLTMAQALEKKGILPGIKVDTGAKPLPGSENEKITEGLDGLRHRLAEYKSLGARFAKWRAVITIGEGMPSVSCLTANAHGLARYAALCQEAQIVPIVEPEVIMEGDHSLEDCYSVTEAALHYVFNALYDHNVMLEGMLLKPNMVISGTKSKTQATPEEVAEASLHCFYNTVPAAVPGIVFLSGGQSPQAATHHLSIMNQMADVHPWAVSFSFGRALQQPALQAWAADPHDTATAQRFLVERCTLSGQAALGQYAPDMEK